MSPWRRSPKPDEQCRAITKDWTDRSVDRSPPHRCRSYAGPNGYCPQHRPPEQADIARDDAPESPV